MNCSTLDELLDVEYGEKGTESREQFDDETQAFCLAQTLREERLRAGLTQEQLAEKIGTKKTYISRIENGKSDVQLEKFAKIGISNGYPKLIGGEKVSPNSLLTHSH